MSFPASGGFFNKIISIQLHYKISKVVWYTSSFHSELKFSVNSYLTVGSKCQVLQWKLRQSLLFSSSISSLLFFTAAPRSLLIFSSCVSIGREALDVEGVGESGLDVRGGCLLSVEEVRGSTWEMENIIFQAFAEKKKSN